MPRLLGVPRRDHQLPVALRTDMPRRRKECPKPPTRPTKRPRKSRRRATQDLPDIEGSVVLCGSDEDERGCLPIRRVREPMELPDLMHTTSAAKSPCARMWMTKYAAAKRKAGKKDVRPEDVCPVELFYKDGDPYVRLCGGDSPHKETSSGRKALPKRGRVLAFESRLEAQKAAQDACAHWSKHASWKGYGPAAKARLGRYGGNGE